MSGSLFQELCAARNSREIRSALEDYAKDEGLSGLDALPREYLGGIENNRGPVEVMVSPKNALYEKVMNGFDALIELYQRQGRFSPEIENAAQALNVIAEDTDAPGVYVITSKADMTTGQIGQPKKRTNVLVIDEGAGILSQTFKGTILSLNGSNKLANRLMAGTYGMGGSAIYRETEFALIYSISEQDPSTVSYTVVYKRYDPTMRFPSYVYLTDEDGDVLTFKVSDLPSSIVMAPGEITAQNVIETAASKIILPRHGTAVKLFELDASFSSTKTNYDFFRDRGFGMKVPLRFRNGVPIQDIDTEQEGEGNTRRFYDTQGMRHSLNDPAARKSYPLRHHSGPVPILVVDGEPQATVECWALTRSEIRKSSDRKRKDSPVEAILGRDRASTPFFVTLNCMTQDNLPSFKLLQKAGLNFISGNVIIEVNCDIMNPHLRGQFFTSSRERIHKSWEDRLKAEIVEFLKMEKRGELGDFDNEMKDKLLASADDDNRDGGTGMALFARVMKTSVAGALFSKFGRSFSSTIAITESVSVRVNPNDNPGGRPARLGPNRIPTVVELNKRTVKQGEAQWITIRTDAYDDWDESISIELPSFLKAIPNGRIALKNGRLSLSVLCDEDIPLESEGVIVVNLDRSRISLPTVTAEAKVMVIRATSKKQKKSERTKQENQAGLPHFKIVPIEGHAGANWDQLRSTGLTQENVAFHYAEESKGTIFLYYNTKFPALNQSLDELTRRKANQAVVTRFTSDYLLSLKLLAIAELNNQHDIDSDDAMKRMHRSRSDAVKVSTLMLMVMNERLNTAVLDTDQDVDIAA